MAKRYILQYSKVSEQVIEVNRKCLRRNTISTPSPTLNLPTPHPLNFHIWNSHTQHGYSRRQSVYIHREAKMSEQAKSTIVRLSQQQLSFLLF